MVEAGAEDARRAHGIARASTTRSASTSSGTRATARTATAPNSTGTTTTASSSTRCCWTSSARARTNRRRGRTSPRAPRRARARYAAVQERLIAADGSFPPIGRSIAYRCGAFHAARAGGAAARACRTASSPAQVRGALDRRRSAARSRRQARSTPTAGCGSGSAATSRASARPTSRPAACICARSRLLPLGLPAPDEFWSRAAAADGPRRRRGRASRSPSITRSRAFQLRYFRVSRCRGRSGRYDDVKHAIGGGRGFSAR